MTLTTGNDFAHTFELGLFRGLNQAYTTAVLGARDKRDLSIHKSIFRGIAKLSDFFHFGPFPDTGLLRKCG
jgi:hypothetical protein